MHIKTMIKRSILLIFIFVVLGRETLDAQNLYVREKVGTHTTYPVSGLNKLTFSAGKITFIKTTGEQVNYNLSDLRYLSFENRLLGITDMNAENSSFSIFPNPAKDKLNIAASVTGWVKLVICTVDGKLQLDKNVYVSGVASVDISSLPQGIYTAKLVDGKSIQTFKLIKQD